MERAGASSSPFFLARDAEVLKHQKFNDSYEILMSQVLIPDHMFNYEHY